MDSIQLKEKLESLSQDSSVKDLQNYIKDMIEVRGFKTTLLKRMCLLTEEIGELAKEVRKTEDIDIDINKNYNSNLQNEIADVFICLMGMCDLLDINVVDIIKIKKKKILKENEIESLIFI